MAKKYYAVKNGKNGVSGIYFSWEDCKAQTEGVQNVRYKGFATLEEAEAFLKGETLPVPGKTQTRRSPAPEQPAPEPPWKDGAAVAYVDGSYHAGTREFSCGAVLFFDHQRIDFSQKNDDPSLAEMHNVAGEIMGSVLVIRYCLEHGIPALEIYHDYRGVGKWAMGEWKTNRPGTQAYAAFCKKARERIKLSFVEVQGHSGDYWNDEADRLAKEALGIS